MAINIEKQRHRQRHIECWQASGLTRTAYCARAGIALSTFDYWRRQAQESLRDKASVTWVPARVEGASGMGADGGICKTACKTFQNSGVNSVQKLPSWVV